MSLMIIGISSDNFVIFANAAVGLIVISSADKNFSLVNGKSHIEIFGLESLN